MTKRMLIAGLWFVSIWGVGGAVHLFLDVPRVLMLLPAIAVAAGMWIALARAEERVTRRPATVSTSRLAMDGGLTTSGADA